MWLSRYMALVPVDIIVFGTPAGTAVESGIDGAAWLRDGDITEVEVEGIGAPVRNPIRR